MINFKKNFFISEIGINHGGNFNTALKMVKVSKKIGFSAVKFQTYTTERRVKKNSPIFEILKKCELSYEEFAEIKKYCDKQKIIFFSTPFDLGAVHFLNKIQVNLFKIASFDISNLELIRAVKKTNKPCIISTGMANKKEIDKVYKLFSKNIKNLILLHCVSSYPCKEEDSFLLVFENSASTSRNCAVLVKLGLVKLAESNTDRRQKDIIFTTLGFKTKSLFNDIPKNAKEAI